MAEVVDLVIRAREKLRLHQGPQVLRQRLRLGLAAEQRREPAPLEARAEHARSAKEQPQSGRQRGDAALQQRQYREGPLVALSERGAADQLLEERGSLSSCKGPSPSIQTR